MQAMNITQQRLLADGVCVADTYLSSLRGLIGKRYLRSGAGLWIVPCQSIHTLWMLFPIDVIFLDKDGTVVHLVEDMKPFRISRHVFQARSVIELPVNTIRRTNTKLGDQLKISED